MMFHSPLSDLGNNDVWSILRRVKQGEKFPFDIVLVKHAPIIVDDLVRPIIALANSLTGGIVYFGVNKHVYVDVLDIEVPDNLDELLSAGVSGIAPGAPVVRSFRRPGNCALVVDSIALRHGFCYEETRGRRDGLYLIDGHSARHPTSNQVEAILDRAGLSNAEMATLGYATDDDLDQLTLSRARLAANDRDRLRNTGVVGEFDGLTRAGAICFGSEALISRYPVLGIMHREYDVGAEEAAARELEPVFERLSPGGAGPGISSLANYLSDWLPVEDASNAGTELFRELLYNAVAHRTLAIRDLDDTQLAVSVAICPDQVRIVSPGGLPRGRVRLLGRDRLDGRFARNPALLRLLERTGCATQKGLGLAKARANAPKVGCRLELVDHPDSFEARVIVDPDVALRVQTYGPATAPTRVRMRPEERHACILDALGEDELSAQDLAAVLGWPLPTVRAALKTMVKKKLVKRCSRSARSPRQRYRVI